MKKKRFVVDVDSEFHKKIKYLAVMHEVGIKKLIVDFLTSWSKSKRNKKGDDKNDS